MNELNPIAIKIAVKIIALYEGCNLVSYPDPASPLYEALSSNGMLQKYMSGKLAHKDMGKNFQALSGAPFTIGYGSTQGITHSMVWTQQQAKEALERHVREFMEGVIKATPKLAKMNPSQIAAATSLAYNIGLGNYKTSTVAKMIEASNVQAAADGFPFWCKAKGKIMAGLVKRRETERNLFLSV